MPLVALNPHYILLLHPTVLSATIQKLLFLFVSSLYLEQLEIDHVLYYFTQQVGSTSSMVQLLRSSQSPIIAAIILIVW